ncbi:MAG TPA: phosphatidylglycerophosphatase A [Acidimicrobiia bacterium]|nr:phosphatidylglycerophosphatase A [Acidimicrobiia bacterium]
MHRILASLFGAGLILRKVRGSDAGSGTIGGLVALPFALLVGETWGWPGQLVATVLVTAAAIWASAGVVESEGDAGWIVIDEAAGVFVATIGLLGWAAVVGFVLFRIVDIFKRPFPGVRQADSLPGATGIVLDDLVAGAWALAMAHLVNATLM